ncbi:aromatic ring-hydroxylating oxygenase subunit alpha [Bradyrhizobium sp. STM 3557]|uniref:aromatic ring-hydroxylating oxygenase subunit alpha n=1 Tax=Bradyrhizobium sp. STM 3557 TaxID=578920 RepID=UPI003890D366
MLTDTTLRQKPWQRLFEQLLSNWNERQSSDWDLGETTLDSTVYTCSEQYRAEVEKLFHRLPLCLGHADQLPIGSMMARTVVGVPMLLTRDDEGSVRVLVNVCRHRGARLLAADGQICRRSKLSCRYHGWTYGLDGRLAGVPRAEAFPTLDRASHGLYELQSTVCHGLIWVVLGREAGPQISVSDYLGGLNDDLAELAIVQQRFFRQNVVLRKANWKLIVDAFVEFYHIKRLHAASIASFFADTEAATESVGPHLRMLVGRSEFGAIQQLPAEEWSPRTHASLVHFVFPNSIIVYHPDYTSHIGVFPVTVDQSLFVHTILTPENPTGQKAQAHWDRSFDLIDGEVFNNEDLFICEQIQLGLAAAESRRFVLGRFENNVRRFHETIAEALAT